MISFYQQSSKFTVPSTADSTVKSPNYYIKLVKY